MSTDTKELSWEPYITDRYYRYPYYVLEPSDRYSGVYPAMIFNHEGMYHFTDQHNKTEPADGEEFSPDFSSADLEECKAVALAWVRMA